MTRIDASTRDAGGMDIYLRQIRDDALLSGEEECTLANAIKAGDKDARARMIRANLRLVVKIARDYAGRGITLDDLIGEGNLGLIRAAEDFDPSFGTRFSTYASYWIKQSIRHALTNTTATIRLPAHMVTLLSKWRKAERALTRELDQAPTFEQVAVTLGLSDAQRVLVERAKRASQLRLEGGDDESWSPDEASDRHAGPEAALEAADERRDLLARLDRLDARERAIVTLRFGLDGDGPLTLKEVGRRLGVTREWVRKIEVRAVKKLDDTPAPAPKTRAKAGTKVRRRKPTSAPAAPAMTHVFA
jgi:RNA polymerase primary sigma factor